MPGPPSLVSGLPSSPTRFRGVRIRSMSEGRDTCGRRTHSVEILKVSLSSVGSFSGSGRLVTLVQQCFTCFVSISSRRTFVVLRFKEDRGQSGRDLKSPSTSTLSVPLCPGSLRKVLFRKGLGPSTSTYLDPQKVFSDTDSMSLFFCTTDEVLINNCPRKIFKFCCCCLVSVASFLYK